MHKCCEWTKAAAPGRLHLNNKFEQKKQVNLQATVYIDSVLNMHSEDLLSCVDRSVKLDKRHQKTVYPASPPLPSPLSTLGSTIKIIHHCGT